MEGKKYGSDKNYRGGRNAGDDRGARGSRGGSGGKNERSGGSYGRSGRNYRSEGGEMIGRSERPGRAFRPDRPFRAEKPERPPKRQEFEKPGDTDRFENDLDKLEGRNSVLEALRAGRSINRILVAKGEREGSVTQIVAIARQNHIVVQEVDRSKLDNLSTTHAHQGVIAFAAAKDYVEVDDILEIAEASGRPPFLVILDEITDAYNLGSILRTADAAGAHGVIIPKRRAIGLTTAVSKASAGAMEHVPVARVTNIVQTIEKLKKNNIWVVGTDSSGEKPFFHSDLKGPVALVIGSEGEGMGKLVRESCDFTVSIPMLGKISSLNAAVAGAIVMYEILRQRSK